MICNSDAKGLETYCGAYLSHDRIMMEELRSGVDMHGANQEAFGLPSRLIAKVLIFRISTEEVGIALQMILILKRYLLLRSFGTRRLRPSMRSTQTSLNGISKLYRR